MKFLKQAVYILGFQKQNYQNMSKSARAFKFHFTEDMFKTRKWSGINFRTTFLSIFW